MVRPVEPVTTLMSPIGSKGYTLFEVLIVFAIISISLIAIPVATGTWTDSARLRSAALDLSSDIQTAKWTATTTGRETVIAIAPGEDSYVIEPPGTQRSLPEGMALEFVPETIEFARPESQQMSFFPTGVSGGGSFRLTLDDSERSLEVLWPSGSVRQVTN